METGLGGGSAPRPESGVVVGSQTMCVGRRLRWVALVLGLVLPLHRTAHAAFDFNDSSWEGTSAFLQLARDKLTRPRVKIIATVDWGVLRAADGLLVLHPTVAIDPVQAGAFLKAGGRLAILDDYGRGTAQFERFGIRRIRAPLRPSQMLRQNPNLAIALPAVQQVAGQEQGRHPIVADVQQLITNHPTGLTHPDLTPVLTIPAVGEPNTTLAVTGIIAGKGRLFVMGDPSVLINLMLRYPGNRAFAEGLVGYLIADDSWGDRGGNLYLVANAFRQRGTYGGGVSLAQETRDTLQGLKEIIEDVRRDGMPSGFAVGFGALAALAALGWAGLNATRRYRRSPPRYARAVPLVAQGGVAGRTAVLAAPTTHRALAVLELKSALEEGLALRLGVGPGTAPSALDAEIVRQDALSRRSLEKLREMLVHMKKAEAAVAAAQPLRIQARRVQQMRADVESILAEVDARGGAVS